MLQGGKIVLKALVLAWSNIHIVDIHSMIYKPYGSSISKRWRIAYS